MKTQSILDVFPKAFAILCKAKYPLNLKPTSLK